MPKKETRWREGGAPDRYPIGWAIDRPLEVSLHQHLREKTKISSHFGPIIRNKFMKVFFCQKENPQLHHDS